MNVYCAECGFTTDDFDNHYDMIKLVEDTGGNVEDLGDDEYEITCPNGHICEVEN
jgi:hypothetical protein